MNESIPGEKSPEAGRHTRELELTWRGPIANSSGQRAHFVESNDVNDVWQRVVKIRDGISIDQDLRRAALNLLEDTEISRRSEEQQSAGRVRAEAAERASEARYRTLFESIDEAFCIIEVLFDETGQKGVDYRFVEVNPAFERHTGFVDAAGRTVRDLVPEHDDFWFQIYGRIALTGEPARFEHRADSMGRDFDVYGFRVGETHDHKVAVLFRDISQRKRQEANLAFLADLSEDLVGLMHTKETMDALAAKIGEHFNVSFCGFSVAGEGRVTTTTGFACNGTDVPSTMAEERLRDYHTEEFVRACRAGENYVVHDAQSDARLNHANIAAPPAGAFVSVPLLYDGEWRFSLSIADPNPRAWRNDDIVLLREIAMRIWTRLERARAEEALRESQERLRLIVENAREYAIVSMDLERRITSWNAGGSHILGYSEKEALGQSVDMIFTPEDRASHAPEKEAEKALAIGLASDERWHLRKDGTRFWASGVMTAMHDATGAALGLLKIFRDHTEERRAQQALEQSLAETQQAQAKSEAASRAKDHFLAVISHELRTPLTPVLLAVDLMEECGENNETTRDALEMIRYNIGIESRFIRDLLDVTRIGYGKLSIAVAPLDLHKVIGRAVSIIQPDCEEKEQRLTVALDAVQTKISGDDARLEQVAWNLLKNASKFTPQKGRIDVRTFNEDGDFVFEVTDSGIGIEASEQPLIFDAFAQANQSISRKFGGLGLGLAIAKAIVDGHGGELRVHSRGRNQGATFRVRLPLLRQNITHLPHEVDPSATRSVHREPGSHTL